MRKLIENKLSNAKADLERIQEARDEYRYICVYSENNDDYNKKHRNFVARYQLNDSEEINEKMYQLIGAIETYEDLLNSKELQVMESKAQAFDVLVDKLGLEICVNSILIANDLEKEEIDNDYGYCCEFYVPNLNKTEYETIRKALEVVING